MTPLPVVARRVDSPAPERAPATMALNVEIAYALDLGVHDAAALDRFVELRPDAGIFVSGAWLSGFFGDAPRGSTPALVLLRGNGVLRAMVPVLITPTRTHTRVALLGGGGGSDRVDLIAERGFEAVAADAFLQWLERTFGRGFLLELRDVPGSSPLWGAVQRAGMEETLKLVLQPREIYTNPYLDLTEDGGAASDAPSSRSLLSVERHWRRLERRCRLEVDLLCDLRDAMRAFEVLASLLHARWKDHPAGSVLDRPRTFRFHQQVIPQLLNAGRLRMIRLTADGRPVAVFYGVAAGGWWGYYLAGYDRTWSGRTHLGQVTLASAIELARREGAREFDFLKGAERNKYVWPVRERVTLDADLFSDRSGAQLARATRATRHAAAALSKSARDLFSAARRT